MNTPAPVWLLAAPFSGASWLAGCLGRHPQLFATPELHLFMAPTVGELLDIFSVGQGPYADGLLRTVAELECGGQTDAGIAAARAWLEQREDWSIDALLAQLCARVAPRRLVVPDSNTPLRPMDLLRLRAARADAAVVHLVRHPWEQGCLLDAWGRERLRVPLDFRDHSVKPARIEPQLPWLRANEGIERTLASWPGAVSYRVRSEAVEQRGDETLAALCGWLGIDADASALAAMAQPEAWCFGGYGPGTAPYGLEPEVLEPYSDDTLDLAQRTSLQRPLPWGDGADGFDPQVIRLAQRYGYS